MMNKRRRIFFQLTPLVDLLLIVVFAQYLGLRSASEVAVREADSRGEAAVIAAQAEAFELQEQVRALSTERARMSADRARLDRTMAGLRTRIDDLERQETTLQADLARLVRERDQVRALHARELQVLGGLASDLLDLPPESLQQALADLTDADRDATLLELDRLRTAPAETLVHHLRRLNEIHKRADVWDIHITSADTVDLRLNNAPVESGVLIRSAEEFAQTLDRALQTQPEPKQLVLLLLSWGNARWGVIADVQTGLEDLRESLMTRYNQTKRFEIGRLGYVAEPPS